MPLEEYKITWVLREKKFFLIVLFIQTLIIILNDLASDYAELLKNSGKALLEIKRLRCLALEMFKTANNLNRYYMKGIFSKATNLTHGPLGINFNQNNTTKYKNNSLRSLGPHIWNSLPSEIKEETECEKRLVWFEMQMQEVLFSKFINSFKFS